MKIVDKCENFSKSFCTFVNVCFTFVDSISSFVTVVDVFTFVDFSHLTTNPRSYFLQAKFKARIESLEALLQEERLKVQAAEKKLSIKDCTVTSVADDSKLREREKEILQQEVHFIDMNSMNEWILFSENPYANVYIDVMEYTMKKPHINNLR